jgi:hypothetical protein
MNEIEIEKLQNEIETLRGQRDCLMTIVRLYEGWYGKIGETNKPVGLIPSGKVPVQGVTDLWRKIQRGKP